MGFLRLLLALVFVAAALFFVGGGILDGYFGTSLFPEELEPVEVTSSKPKEIEPEFADLVGQISLQTLEKADRKRRNQQQQQQKGQKQGQRPQQATGNRQQATGNKQQGQQGNRPQRPPQGNQGQQGGSNQGRPPQRPQGPRPPRQQRPPQKGS